MPRSHVVISKWTAYALSLCLLAWSFVRLLRFNAASGLYWLLVVFVAATTVGWAVAGFVLLSRWHQIKTIVVGPSRRSRLAYWGLWSGPTLLWLCAFALYRLAVPLDASLVDGPTLVLVAGGSGLLLCLIAHLPQSEEAQIDLPEVATRSDPPNSPWRSVPPVLATAVSIVAITVVPLLIFRHSLFDPDAIVFGLDVNNLYYMFERYIREALHEGHLPLWNPYLFSGSPALSHPQYLVFYPPQLLLRLLPLNLSLSWSVAIHVWIAGIGTFALCRRLGLERWIALTCALVYMINSGLVLRVFAGHWWLVYALAWVPLVWTLIMVALDTGRAMAIAGASMGVAMIILTGHPTFPMYILLFFGLYWICVCTTLWRNSRSWGAIRATTWRFVAIMLLALGLSAIQLVPTVVLYTQISVAGGYDPDRVNWLALSVPDLLAIIIPRFSLSPANRFFYWDHVPYLGSLLVLLSPFVFVVRPRSSLVYFLGAIAGFSLAIAFGESLGVFPLLCTLVPPLRVSRIPPRALAMWIPVLTLLGGFGLQSIHRRSVDARWFDLGTQVYTAASLFLLGSAVGHWPVARALIFPKEVSAGGLFAIQLVIIGAVCLLLQVLLARGPSRRFGPIATPSVLVGTALLGYLVGVFIIPPDLSLAFTLVASGLFVGMSSVLARFLYKHGPTPLGVLLVSVLIWLDLGSFSLPHISTGAPPVFYQEERTVLQYAVPDKFGRVLSTEGRLNQYSLGQISHVDGYNTGILQGYDAFLRTVSTDAGTTASGILSKHSKVDRGAVDFLGVEYIISTEPLESERFELVAVHDRYRLYYNPGAFHRVYVVYEVRAVDSVDAASAVLKDRDFDYASSVVLFDAADAQVDRAGTASVTIDEHSPYNGDLTMTVYTSEPGVLVMSEPYYSERKAWVDGQEQEVLRANVGFSAVAVSAGTHTVELRYVPTSLYVGGAVTASAILICVVIVLASNLRTWSRAPG